MFKEGDRLVTGHRLVKFLGRGNFGEVWQAMAPGNTYAALKFLNLEQSQGRKEYRAIQPLKHLRHAHLLQMTAIWLLDENGEIIPDDQVNDGILLDTVRGTLASVTRVPDDHRPATLIIAMPFADKSLDHLLKEYKQKGVEGIPRDELIEYMEDAAKAIDFLNAPKHDLGEGPVAIRHCDVKPENLLLMGQSVVLCDFGVSRTILGSSATRKTTMGGSLAYMAPECVNDEVTPYSDQFSLAISYLELRTGKLPFEDLSQAGVIDQRRRGILDLSELPSAEAAVIRRATSLQPSRRFANAVDMVDALRAATSRPPGLSNWKLIGSAVALASLATAVGVTLWPKPKPEKGGEGTTQEPEVPLPLPAWQEQENIALKLLDQPSLSNEQWQEAVRAMTQAIETGLPSDRLAFRSAINLPSPVLRDTEKAAYLPNVFAVKPDNELVSIQRIDKSVSLAGYRDNRVVSSSDIVFDEIHNLGIFHSQVIASGKQQDKYLIQAFNSTTDLPAPLNQYRSSNGPTELCFAGNGQAAVLLDWGADQLLTLDGQSARLSLADIDYFSTPTTRLSVDGKWVAIQTSRSLHVAGLEASGKLERLALPTDDPNVSFNIKEEMLSIQTDETFGYITLRKEQSSVNESMNLAQLIRFPLAAPTQYELLEVPQTTEAFYARLEKVGGKIQLLIGCVDATVLFVPDVADYASPRKIYAKSDSGTIVSCALDSQSPVAKWLVFGTDSNRLYLQSLDDNANLIEIAKTSSGPRYIHLDERHLITGSDEGDVEIYDFRQIRLMFEAAIRRNKAVAPAKASASIRS